MNDIKLYAEIERDIDSLIRLTRNMVNTGEARKTKTSKYHQMIG